jgi:hypothetical protein
MGPTRYKPLEALTAYKKVPTVRRLLDPAVP